MATSQQDHEAAESNTPKDESGGGPVTLGDRTEPGGEGSPGSNQASGEVDSEPMGGPGSTDAPLVPPDLEDMNVGISDLQAPRHPDALHSDLSSTGAYADASAGDQPTGPEPLQATGGTAHHAPGIQGTTPEGESVATDTEAGAARMGPQALDSRAGESPGQGDAQSVPSSGAAATPGTSEEHRIVSGIRLPADDE